MATVCFSARLLSGRAIVFEVEPETPISEIKERLQEGLPPFYETRIYASHVELGHGTIAEVGIVAGTVVEVVKSLSIDQAFDFLLQYLESLYIDGDRTSPSGSDDDVVVALKILEQSEESLTTKHYERLAHVVMPDPGQAGFFYCFTPRDEPHDVDSLIMKLYFGLLGKFGDRETADGFKNEFAEIETFQRFGIGNCDEEEHGPLPDYNIVIALATTAVAQIRNRFEIPRDHKIHEAGQNFIAKEPRGVDGEDVRSVGLSNVNTSCTPTTPPTHLTPITWARPSDVTACRDTFRIALTSHHIIHGKYTYPTLCQMVHGAQRCGFARLLA